MNSSHPDKAKEISEILHAEEKHSNVDFLDISFAYEVLSDPDKKEEYDRLMLYGIPQSHRYYAEYAYRYGAPNVAVEYVVGGFLFGVTILELLYKWQRHILLTNRAKQTVRYKTRLEQLKLEGIQTEPEVVVFGAENPRLRDLLLVKLFMFPFRVLLKLYSFFTEDSRKKSQKWKEDFHMSEKEWKLLQERQLEKYEENRTSARAKRARRWMKKNR